MRALTLPLLLVSSLATAQADFAILLKGDTLRGEVRVLTYDLIDRVLVKSDTKKKEIFTATQVRSIFLGGEIYQPVKIENNIQMMKLISPGYLSLYGFRMGNQPTYDGLYLVKLGGISMEVPNISFKKSMTSFLSDCPTVSNQIKNGHWGKKEMDSITYHYNQCIASMHSNEAQPTRNATEHESLAQIENIRTKVEASTLVDKKDVLDLLADLSRKMESHQPIPNYLIEGLKSYLGSHAEFSESLEELIKAVTTH